MYTYTCALCMYTCGRVRGVSERVFARLEVPEYTVTILAPSR